jgi:hypothetical protein
MPSKHVIKYVVSTDPESLYPGATDDDTITTYRTPEQAVASITAGLHGDFGTRYVLKIELEVVATATRPWAIVPKDA